jgi:hypothetical protein
VHVSGPFFLQHWRGPAASVRRYNQPYAARRL